jgi:hypothetical protein
MIPTGFLIHFSFQFNNALLIFSGETPNDTAGDGTKVFSTNVTELENLPQ